MMQTDIISIKKSYLSHLWLQENYIPMATHSFPVMNQ